MPPRYAYWTIIAGGLPTAFRAADREDLLPTFKRLKEKQPDAEMKWFARGKLWASPEEARAAQHRGGRDQRDARGPFKPREHRDRPHGGDRRDSRDARGPRDSRDARGARDSRTPNHESRPPKPESRDRNWRPGGEHRDPRQKFIDARKDRNATLRKERWQRKNAEGVRKQESGFRGGQGDRPKGPGAGGFRNRESGFRGGSGERPKGPGFEGAGFKGAGFKGSGFKGSGDRPTGPGFPRERKPWEEKKPWQRDKPWQQDKRSQHDKPWKQGQGTDEPQQPPRPRGPNREPKPSENPQPTRPPHPEEPIVPPPGPPEQGRKGQRPFRPEKRFRRR